MTYASAARPYTAAGWATLPLPPGKKYPPPSGYTGYAGRPPTLDEIERWIADPATADGNIALRLPGDVVALDIDDHDGDHAGPDTLASLETERGALPATWVSTARGDDDGPGATGHRFYRVPMGTRLRTGAGAGVDIIQRHHRYAVVAPSVHPEGTAYRWYEPGGEPSDRLPRIDELPELPWAWVEALAAPAEAEGTRVDAVAPEAVGAFVAANTEASSPSALRGLRSTLDRMRSKGKGRHDTLVAGACMAAREAAAGRYSAGSGFEELRGWWSDVMSAEPVECRQVVAPSEVRIVVLQRGWIVVGRWSQDGDEVVVLNASVVRFWGTTRGLGELVAGPTKTTKLDPAGTVRANAAAVVLTIDVDAEAWAEHL